MFSLLRKLMSRGSAHRAKVEPKFDPQLFIYVRIPGDVQPLARGARFEDPLEELLQTAALGHISGGGSQLDDPYPDGSSRVEFCGLDIDTTDLDAARDMLMRELLNLKAPSGTELQYRKGTSMLLDRLADGAWQRGLPRTTTHPGFGW
jgi:hypothetical protein